MSIASQVEEILLEAERKLAELTAVALKRRDYATVKWVSAIAERIASDGIKGDPQGEFGPADDASIIEKSTQEGSTSGELSGHTGLSELNSPVIAPAPFPHFHRDGDQLIKIGYSKSERRTYEHRSPREVLEKLAEHLVEFSLNGQLFTTEGIITQFARARPASPTYQIYLCLAFLIRSGLVRKNGRLGYTIERDQAGDFVAAVKAKWELLPER